MRNTAALVGRSDEQAVCELKPDAVGVTRCSGCCLVVCLVTAGLSNVLVAMCVLCWMALVVTTGVWPARWTRVPGEGGSNLWERFLGDRAALSREFSRNSGPGVLNLFFKSDKQKLDMEGTKMREPKEKASARNEQMPIDDDYLSL